MYKVAQSALILFLLATPFAKCQQCIFFNDIKPKLPPELSVSKDIEIAQYGWDDTNILAYKATHKFKNPKRFTFNNYPLEDFYLRLDSTRTIKGLHISFISEGEILNILTEKYGLYQRIIETSFDLQTENEFENVMSSVYFWTTKQCKVSIDFIMLEDRKGGLNDKVLARMRIDLL